MDQDSVVFERGCQTAYMHIVRATLAAVAMLGSLQVSTKVAVGTVPSGGALRGV